MSPEIPESPEMISGNGGGKESSNSGISIDTGILYSPCPPKPDPLRRPEVLTLDLTTEQAAQFSGLGEAFAVIGKGSYPGHVGRLCLYALPVPHDVATACCNVALGLARAVKIKPAATATPGTATAVPANTA
jgi:hypothetical protein